FSLGLDRESCRTRACGGGWTPTAAASPESASPAGSQCGLEAVPLIAQLLITKLLRPSQHQFRQKPGDGFESLEILLVAITKRQLQMHFLATSFPRQKGDLDPFGKLLPLHASFDIFRSSIEGLSFSDCSATMI